MAHKYSYECFIGPVPRGQKVLHECDNPACCSPFHLVAGTQRENVLDAVSKGRWNRPSGEDHWRRKRAAKTAF